MGFRDKYDTRGLNFTPQGAVIMLTAIKKVVWLCFL